jgi:hypothetical protein
MGGQDLAGNPSRGAKPTFWARVQDHDTTFGSVTAKDYHGVYVYSKSHNQIIRFLRDSPHDGIDVLTATRWVKASRRLARYLGGPDYRECETAADRRARDEESADELALLKTVGLRQAIVRRLVLRAGCPLHVFEEEDAPADEIDEYREMLAREQLAWEQEQLEPNDVTEQSRSPVDTSAGAPDIPSGVRDKLSASFQPVRDEISARLRGSYLAWIISPPMNQGAPIAVEDRQVRRAEVEQGARLKPFLPISDALQSEAREGMERGHRRLAEIEATAKTYVQITGLTTTLAIANFAIGHGRIAGALSIVSSTALAGASIAAIVAGIYGLSAATRHLPLITPNNSRRVLQRARAKSEREARWMHLSAVLVSTYRVGLVADWKSCRVKRATLCLRAVVLLGVISSAALYARLLGLGF